MSDKIHETAPIPSTDVTATENNNSMDSNKINNNVINHPLSNVQVNKNNINDEFDDEMMEINLKMDNVVDIGVKKLNSTIESSDKTSSSAKTSADQQTKSSEKSNWVKFDEENNENKFGNLNENLNISNNNINNNHNSDNNDNMSIARSPTSAQKLSTTSNTQHSLPHNKNILNSQPKSLQKPTQVNKITSNEPSGDVAVIRTESVHVNIDRINSSNVNSPGSNDASNNNSTQHQNNQPKNVAIQIPTSSPIRTVELSTGRIREGFANGDIIVNLLPTNTKWPWITPAVFRPELVPEELMAQGLTLTVEEYVAAMETLVNDYRFTLYNICYKRVLVCWIAFAFCVLLVLLFSGLQGIALFSLGVAWLFLNAAAIFACMWMKLRLSRGLEKCLARVNKQLLRHKILLVLDDRGRISCHKVNLCFMYFDPAQCIAFLNEFIERQEQLGNSIQAGWEKRLDLDINDIVIQGSNPVRLSRKQAVAQEIFLTYLQRWGKDFLRRRLDWTCNEAGVHEQPRHLMSSVCPCQYEEEILHSKIKLDQDKTRCCCGLHNPFKHL